MKKLCISLLILLLLCSCGVKKEITPRLSGISFTAEINYYNENYTLDGVISKDGKFLAEIKEPEELRDLVITLDGDKTQVNYKGLVYTPLEGSMPFAGVLSEFYGQICKIIKDEPVSSTSDGIIKGDGFTLTVSPTGLPLKLEIPDERFTFNFYNVSICEE